MGNNNNNKSADSLRYKFKSGQGVVLLHEDGSESLLEDYLDEQLSSATTDDSAEFFKRVQEVSQNPEASQIKELEQEIIEDKVRGPSSGTLVCQSLLTRHPFH